MLNKNTPVLIGVGQAVEHWDGADGSVAPSPLSMARTAGAKALADTGMADGVCRSIDRVYFIRTLHDSVKAAPQAVGRCTNLPATLANELGLAPKRAIYSMVGGDQPQALVNQAAEAIAAGDAEGVLIAGGEAIAAQRLAGKMRVKLDWSRSVDGPMEDRGLGPEMLSAYEWRNGLGPPTQTYPLFEHALRTRLGLGRKQYVDLISDLWAGFSQVAAVNPYAQFPLARSTQFLATPSRENYAIADPYLKWHVAQDAVNQGAAVVMTSAGTAARLGVDLNKLVYLHGYAQAADRAVAERADLSRSLAMSLALGHALAAAGKTAADVNHFDLYSCFPCAVLLAAEALGLDWRNTPATVTGGLSFFGGPGNNYSLHAIATMTGRLRDNPGDFGLVLANGGFLSKEAVGIYSTTPVADWRPVSSAKIQRTIDECASPSLMSESGDAVVESFSVTYSKDAPSRAYVVARMDGGRVIARARSGHRTTMVALASSDPVGQTIRIVNECGVNYIASPEFAARQFQYVSAVRRGHLLEVAINRPDSMNALHSATHFELHEVWDEFERDDGLWVAIITGAGERAFCSGNDLKVTAKGGDMALPRSGFGGLTARFDREKPIIAAINGVAMGGGLEIVLACDLAIADEHAKLALPEVKVGLFAAAGGVQRLTRQIGRKAAMRMILTGQSVDATEAERLGLVNGVVPSGTSLAAARVLADTLLANSPSAIRASKQALNKLDETEALKDAFEANAPIFNRLFRTRDFREGVTAFAEKRSPHWTNS